MAGLGPLASGVGQILGRTVFLLRRSPTGIPIPLAVLDVVSEEKPEYSAEVTEFPVEYGPEITDHIQRKNPILRLKGKMSNTPLDVSVAIANTIAGGIAAATDSQARSNLLNSSFSQGVGLVGSAMQGNAGNLTSSAVAGAMDAIARTILITAYQNALPFDVITKRLKYADMVIQRLSFPRTEDTGYALEFEIELKQVRIIPSTSVVKDQVSENAISGACTATNIGSQSTQQISPQMESQISGSSLGSVPGMSTSFPGVFA